MTHDFQKQGRQVYYQWSGGWLSAPNPQFIFSQKSSSRNCPPPPRGKDTVGQSHHTRIPTFPSSVEGEGNSQGEREPGTTFRPTHKTRERLSPGVTRLAVRPGQGRSDSRDLSETGTLTSHTSCRWPRASQAPARP